MAKISETVFCGDSSRKLRGFCYCGEVTFEVDDDVDTDMRGMCHCESCRRAHSTPLYQVVYVPIEKFRIKTGADQIKKFSKSDERPVRCFCSNCGSKIMNLLPHKPNVVGFFPSLLEEDVQHNLPAAFTPLKHFCEEETVLNLSKIGNDLLGLRTAANCES